MTHDLFHRAPVGPVAYVVFFWTVLIGAAPAVALEEKPTVDGIKATWLDRIERLPPVRIEWSTVVVDNDVAEDAEGNRPEFTTTSRLSIQGKKTRYSLSGVRPLVNRQAGAQDFVSAFDGEVSSSLWDPSTDRAYRYGHIFTTQYSNEVKTLNCRPVIWLYAPFDPVSELDFPLLTLQETPVRVDDEDCWVLLKTVGDFTLTYTLAPSRGFSIIRQAIREGQRSVSQLDCSYEHKFDQWMPMQWTYTRVAPTGEPVLVERTTVTTLEANPEFSDDEFKLDFPAGTVVSDQRSQPGIGRTGTFDYIVMKDGSRRQITWDERHATYEELVNTPAGSAVKGAGHQETSRKRPSGGFSVNVAFLAVNAVAVVLLVLLYFVRSRR